MPVCYEFDATTNWLGVNGATIDFTTTASSLTEGTTTAEGYQNEGKFIRVEDPDADNIHAFAGVVAGADHAGKTGPRKIDIYIPNGAIVPVRTDQSCTVGRTVLAVHTAEQHLTGPYETAGRPVAIAWETNTDLATTAGLVLAKLDPNLFISQKGDATTLLVDDQDTGQTLWLNQIKVEFASATGNVCAMSVQSTCSAGAGSDGYGASLYVQGDLTGVAASAWNPFGCWANITSGTQTGVALCAAEFGVYASGAHLSAVSHLSIITLRNQVSSTNSPDDVHSIIRIVQDGGGDSADALFSIYTPETVGMVGCSDTPDYAIPIIIENTGGGPAAGTYYLAVCSALS